MGAGRVSSVACLLACWLACLSVLLTNAPSNAVSVTGSFRAWKTELPMTRDEDGTFIAVEELEPGIHQVSRRRAVI